MIDTWIKWMQSRMLSGRRTENHPFVDICSTCRTKNEATPCRGCECGKSMEDFLSSIGATNPDQVLWETQLKLAPMTWCWLQGPKQINAQAGTDSNYLTAAVRGLVVFRGLKCSYWLDILGSWSNHHSYIQVKMVSNIIGSVPVWDECRNSADGWRHTQIT